MTNLCGLREWAKTSVTGLEKLLGLQLAAHVPITKI